ncbi:MAG: bifunctional precorrin-2 dehydrogenase/sirohydrochlorin ferrochelatase [Campylobacterales bacterium]|nr:bifunctional precorrin-2 dehydrogenase/sirohydrochlorin ferrochelatase [Campylobacterales bacterium]
MSYFPLYLDLQSQRILVVGGGKIGTKKVQTLIKFTKNITVISPKFSKDLRKVKVKKNKREYEKRDLKNIDIVIAATDNPKLQKKIYKQTRKRKILCNCVNDKKMCDFIFPSIIEKDGFTISISSSGKSPTLTKKMRIFLEEKLSKK